MRIVNRQQFLALPAGTLYAKYNLGSFEGLQIKWQTIGGDFISQSLVDSVAATDDLDLCQRLDAAEAGDSVAMDFDCAERDGEFDPDQMFAVFEKDDALALLGALQAAIDQAY